jgi:hypothetical protein
MIMLEGTSLASVLLVPRGTGSGTIIIKQRKYRTSLHAIDLTQTAHDDTNHEAQLAHISLVQSFFIRVLRAARTGPAAALVLPGVVSTTTTSNKMVVAPAAVVVALSRPRRRFVHECRRVVATMI